MLHCGCKFMKKLRLIFLIACFSVKIKNARLLRHENASYVMSEVKKIKEKHYVGGIAMQLLRNTRVSQPGKLRHYYA